MTSDMLIRFFENYGWIMTVLATSGIIIVGFLKACGVFNKISESYRKYVYFGVSCVISVVACTIYLCASKQFEWASWGITAACIIGFTLTLYGVYENTGLRDLLKKVIFTPLKNALKKAETSIVESSISTERLGEMALGLGADVLMALAEQAKQKQAEEEPLTIEDSVADVQEENSTTDTVAEKIVEPGDNTPKIDDKYYG